MRKQAQVAGTSSHLGCLESCFQAVLELSVPEGPDSSLPRHRFSLVGLSPSTHSMAGILSEAGERE